LRAIVNPRDEVSLTRIVNTPPRGLGDTSIKLMQAYSVAAGTSLYETMQKASNVAGLSTRAVSAMAKFVQLVESWRAMAERSAQSREIFDAPRGPVQTLMEDVVRRSGLEESLRKSEKASVAAEEGDSALANVNELISSAAEYERENPEGSLQDYLSAVSLVSDADHLKGNGGAVTLMTLHAAKGLEFPVVAIIGMEEGILPHSRARGSLPELEEERRLAFVGITRAQQHLILTKAAYRTVRGLRERTVTSPFVGELPSDALEITDRSSLAWGGSLDEQRERVSDENQRLSSQFHAGQMVRHPTFFVCRIADVVDMGQHTRAVIEFKAAGKKTLILQYARLEPVG
jgi:DNA helicase-2/ATP-dependent DNA helicase PcrA